ncbi:MAG: hypothetical protein II008_06955 [Oscillospiraceae bacterium]|nr:hypothetical protein [Oscillospiraceae bacterium]
MDEIKLAHPNETSDSINLQGTILGSVLEDPHLVGQVVTALEPEDFSDLLATVFRTIRRLYLDGDPIDPITVLHRIGDAESDSVWPEVLEKIRGMAVENPAPYCRMLRERVILERMKSEALGVQYAGDLTTATEAAERLIGCLSDRTQMRKTSAQDAAFAFLDRLDKKKENFVEWGIDGLDAPSTHTSLGDFVVLGGYPSAGKSMLAGQISERLARRFRVAYFSCEMSEKDITERNLARMSGVPLDVIQEGRFTKNQVKSLVKAAEEYHDLQFTVFESAGTSVSRIEAETLAGRYQAVIVDYMQLLKAPGASRYDRVTEISMGLHALARKHNVLVIALAQLSRPEKPSKDAKPVPPSMSSFRESGQIEQDADLALLLYLENPNDPKSNRILKIAKNRKAQRGPKLTLEFHGDTQLFTETIPPREWKPKPTGRKRPGESSREIYGQEELP